MLWIFWSQNLHFQAQIKYLYHNLFNATFQEWRNLIKNSSLLSENSPRAFFLKNCPLALDVGLDYKNIFSFYFIMHFYVKFLLFGAYLCFTESYPYFMYLFYARVPLYGLLWPIWLNLDTIYFISFFYIIVFIANTQLKQYLFGMALTECQDWVASDLPQYKFRRELEKIKKIKKIMTAGPV